MESIKNYLFSIMLVSVAAGAAEILAPEGEGGGLKKHVRLLVSLIVLAVLIAPVSGLLGYISNFDNYRGLFGAGHPGEGDFSAQAENTRQRILERGESEVAAGVTALLYDRFGIPGEEAKVVPELATGDAGIEVKKLTIVLYGRSVWKNPYEIEDYFVRLLGCPCEVIA